jgi:hypothetical protein
MTIFSTDYFIVGLAEQQKRWGTHDWEDAVVIQVGGPDSTLKWPQRVCKRCGYFTPLEGYANESCGEHRMRRALE